MEPAASSTNAVVQNPESKGNITISGEKSAKESTMAQQLEMSTSTPQYPPPAKNSQIVRRASSDLQTNKQEPAAATSTVSLAPDVSSLLQKAIEVKSHVEQQQPQYKSNNSPSLHFLTEHQELPHITEIMERPDAKEIIDSSLDINVDLHNFSEIVAAQNISPVGSSFNIESEGEECSITSTIGIEPKEVAQRWESVSSMDEDKEIREVTSPVTISYLSPSQTLESIPLTLEMTDSSENEGRLVICVIKTHKLD